MNRASLIGTPCESAYHDGRGRFGKLEPRNGPLCGKPARFMWLGFDPTHLNKTAAERKKYIRANLVLCWDCAMRIYESFCWLLKDGKARLERLDGVKFHMHCIECGANLYISWDTDVTQPNPGQIKWCPRCGRRGATEMDHHRDFMEIMAHDLAENGVEPDARLVQMLYEDWPRQDRRWESFYEFFKFVMAHPEEMDKLGA